LTVPGGQIIFCTNPVLILDAHRSLEISQLSSPVYWNVYVTSEVPGFKSFFRTLKWEKRLRCKRRNAVWN